MVYTIRPDNNHKMSSLLGNRQAIITSFIGYGSNYHIPLAQLNNDFRLSGNCRDLAIYGGRSE